MGLAWDDGLTAAVDYADDALQSGRPTPIAALLKWDFAVPLLVAERYRPDFKTLGGMGRVRPGEPAFARTVCLALAILAHRDAGGRGVQPISGNVWPALFASRILDPFQSASTYSVSRSRRGQDGYPHVRSLNNQRGFNEPLPLLGFPHAGQLSGHL
ncbi:DUF1403 family protein [Shinella sp.]|uniref:DUF1403 family protein n=1 Tax=Shinella sp. TaxID=1870904 RepID=UPI002899D9B3|nr:DUF1403 family protein [Shinella sp.]